MAEPLNENGPLILTIDAGTQSIRAALVDLRGNIVDMVKTPIEPYFSAHPGWAEQEPGYYWDMFCRTCQALWEKTGDVKNRIKGVSVTTQRATVVNVDQNGQSLRPAIVWLDQRKADSTKILHSALRPLLKVLKLHQFIDTVIQSCQINWIKQNQPEIWGKTHKYLLLSGYFNFKLTGAFSDSIGSNVGYLPINTKTYQWAGPYDLKWKLFPVERDKLPELVKPGEVLGHITSGASRETGIAAGLPVIAAASDKACEVLGAGCLTPEIACLSFGTIATVNTAIQRYVELRPFVPPYPAAVPDQYYTEVAIMRGFWMVTWFKEQFGLKEKLEAEEAGVTPEMLFERIIREVPPGSMGLVLQPHWSPGPHMEKYAKGSIIGFGDVHTRGHLYRAMIEGLIFGLKEGAELTAKKNKTPITRLRISGGGSMSDTAMQIAADIFGMPAERPLTHETSAIGAAIDAAVGLGLFTDFPSAVKAMTGVKQVFEPIDENCRIYKHLYENVYTKVSAKLMPLYREIQNITGYPE
ncbi:MAG: carbohydrate kinase [Desulfobacteraceae bacterium]|nr:MAG: carbohydrate kinase [Desulfobacteraceae bacterium]